uniref:HNH nuclease domain-containing protein n=1 Tax=Leptocylindrus danicus TaxID=163516 RepID=A0A7S2PLA7_9STRA|mmetsp:Transcript_4567/g.6682  ORF Transcript_4567/g.6682 Transcript_4567/m.6682 type:complete len:370 (+) Transcript_4567:143-1252(+)|eukprot:CAMPEP_0116020700 /NCGR_PEP_ID=MMETSP0321-20121206/9954_1 /TAXON_ID=163516 /ORGANISM="Leptocylindrus danicus var. danicus, Strain B650" /LENGTH=369 /DNA_ID=CAMNT_0003491443 /DNA_START=66 /DNA_END=1175 /DNA_ORIENTATION=+
MKVSTAAIIVALTHTCFIQNNDELYVTAAFTTSVQHGTATRSSGVVLQLYNHNNNRFNSSATRLFSLSHSRNGVSTTKKKMKRARRKGELDPFNAPGDHDLQHGNKHDSDDMFFDESSPETVARKKREASLSARTSNKQVSMRDGVATISDARARHMEYMKKLDGRPALVLNADYQPLSHIPLSLWSWQDAIKAVFAGRVTVVDVYPGVSIQSIHMEIPLPSVIALNEYVPQASQSTPPFSRKNVFLRDGYRCQYCGQRFRSADLSLDHYVPRCMGGTLTWTNTVSACRKCNGRKGNLMPRDLKGIGMKPLREPREPTTYELNREAGQLLKPRKVHPTWEPYLGLVGWKSSDRPRRDSGEGGKENAVEF